MNSKEKQIKPFTEEWIKHQNKRILKRFGIGLIVALFVFGFFMADGPSIHKIILSKMGIMTQSEAKVLLADFEEHYFGQFVFEYKDYAGLKKDFLKARTMTYHGFYEYFDSIAKMANDYSSSFIFNTPEAPYYDNYLAKLQDVSPVIEVKEIAGVSVGYIKMKAISSKVNDQVATILKSFEEKGIKSLILDVTDSPLGTTEEIVRFLDYFISNDEIVRYQTKDGFYAVYKAQAGAYDYNNVYVLISDEVSGPGEIIAASLKNHLRDKADLIGKVPYGIPFLFDYTINETHGYIFKYATGVWQVGNEAPGEVQWEISDLQSDFSMDRSLEWIETDLK